MYIHNLYNDLMLSTTILFDNVIFQNKKVIERYEFNLGNRTFQFRKDPEINVDLPVAIISINDESSYFGQRTESIKRLTGFDNVNNIPVLYNQTNNKILYLHEEYMNVPISISINTESQLHAKEISHIVKRTMPVNKWIELFEFSSFLEVEMPFLKSTEFNPLSHDIMNLFTRFNKLTGNMDYYFSVRYKPMIRLDSVSATAPDSTQRTFQTTIDLVYGLQWPVFLFSEEKHYIENITVQLSVDSFQPISYQSPVELFDKNKSIKNYIIYDDQEYKTQFDDRVCYYFEFDKDYIDVSKEDQRYNLISMNRKQFLYDITPYSCNTEDNTVTFCLSLDEYEMIKPNLVNPVILQTINN